MVAVSYKRLSRATAPVVSFILADWSCRESLHTLDYLAQQDIERDSYEIIWIEYYQQRQPTLDQKLADYADRGLPPPLDVCAVLGMDRSLYYHKHLMYNTGIAQSRGDIVVICDSDGMFPPNFVRTVIQTFEENPNSLVHFDEVRNGRADFYPFNYPSFEDVIGPGVINWHDGKTTGLWDTEDPLHNRNYGACFCARRADLIAIGGADEHLDYVGHVCGPYEMTFRLMNKGLHEIWHDKTFLYHTWHPGSDGEFNYIGPSDGRNMSSTALAIRENGRVMPLLENAAVRGLREGREVDWDALIDASYRDAWTEEAVRQSPRFKLFKHGQGAPKLVMSLDEHNVVEYDGRYYGLPHALGPLDLNKESDRARDGVVLAESAEAVRNLIAAGTVPQAEPTPPAPEYAATPAPVSSETNIERTATTRVTEIVAQLAENGLTRSGMPVAAAVDTTPRTPLADHSPPGALGAFADELLKIATRGQTDWDVIEQRLLRLERQSRSQVDVEQLRAALSGNEKTIADLQQEVADLHQQRAKLEREALHWRGEALRRPDGIELLPLLSRKNVASNIGRSVSVSPTSELGHFLFGPYLPLEPGRYMVCLVARVGRVKSDGEPILAVEVADGSEVLAAQAFFAADLMDLVSIEFSVSPHAGQNVEFRLSHYGNAGFEIAGVQLAAAIPVSAGLRSRTFWRRLWQPFQVFQRGRFPRPNLEIPPRLKPQ